MLKRMPLFLNIMINDSLTPLNTDHLMESNPWGQEAIRLRNIYVEPLNMLQAELLYRTRQHSNNAQTLEEALMVTIAGIATGM